MLVQFRKLLIRDTVDEPVGPKRVRHIIYTASEEKKLYLVTVHFVTVTKRV